MLGWETRQIFLMLSSGENNEEKKGTGNRLGYVYGFCEPAEADELIIWQNFHGLPQPSELTDLVRIVAK